MNSAPIVEQALAGNLSPATPSPAGDLQDLAKFVARPFRARDGCYRQSRTAGLQITSNPAQQPQRVDIAVQLFVRRMASPKTPEEAQITNMTLEIATRLLRNRRSELRLSACQKIARLGRSDCEAELVELARNDPDPGVRAMAQSTLESLQAAQPPEGIFAEIELCLMGALPEGEIELARARTDQAGRACFKNIPADTTCSLHARFELGSAMAAAEGFPLVFEPIRFSHSTPTVGRIGFHEMLISPQPGREQARFDAVLRFAAPPATAENRIPFRLLARHGQHLYQPEPATEEGAVLTFSGLPLGHFDLLCTQARPAEAALAARSAPEPGGSRPSLGESLQWVVHPADRRLLATIEPDFSGRVVLTVASALPELHGSIVHYELLGESGAMELERLPGTQAARAVRYLDQPFSADCALHLSLELRPGVDSMPGESDRD